MRIAVAGASGFLGTPLVERLRASGHSVLTLSRSADGSSPDKVRWDPYSGLLPPEALQGVDAVINLAGENLGERWSEERKKAFRESRLLSTALLARTMADLNPRPGVFLSASAVGIYGNERGDERLDENARTGDDFLALLCIDWEEAARPAIDAGIRVVFPRSGVAIHPSGGMLEKLLTPFRLGAGGKAGSGEQWVSWISRDDWTSAMQFLIEQGPDGLSGPVNVTSPHPVQNKELAETLGRVMHRPSVATVPATVLRLMFGREMADETVLASQRVLPNRLLAAGFIFRYPELEEALKHEMGL